MVMAAAEHLSVVGIEIPTQSTFCVLTIVSPSSKCCSMWKSPDSSKEGGGGNQQEISLPVFNLMPQDFMRSRVNFEDSQGNLLLTVCCVTTAGGFVQLAGQDMPRDFGGGAWDIV
eukprot:g35515.t1